MPQKVNKLYAKKIVQLVLDGNWNGNNTIIRLIVPVLEDFFAKRLDELDRQLDSIAGEPSVPLETK